MRSRYRIHEKTQAHFVAATIVEWLPVFNSSACCDLVLRSLEFCRERKGLVIYGWVILDSHLHAILAAPELSAVLRDWKSFTAQQILAQLPHEGRDWLVNQLAYYRAAHKSTAHQVWQEGSHPQAIGSDAMLEQKLELPGHWRSQAEAWEREALRVRVAWACGRTGAHGWLTSGRRRNL